MGRFVGSALGSVLGSQVQENHPGVERDRKEAVPEQNIRDKGMAQPENHGMC